MVTVKYVNIRDYSRALSPVLHARCKLNIAIPGRLYQAVCAFVFDIRSQAFLPVSVLPVFFNRSAWSWYTSSKRPRCSGVRR